MAAKSDIEWTDASWTPIRARRIDPNDGTVTLGWHCEHVSEGCRNCYAEAMNRRLGTGLDYKPGHLGPVEAGKVELFLDEEMLTAPLRWKKPRRIFVCSMTDLFASFVPDEWIDRIFAVMALCPQHTFQVLTKRPQRMWAYFDDDAGRRRGIRAAYKAGLFPEGALPEWPLPNVWLGTSAEDQKTADARIPHLLATPAAIRFLSLEPLLGAIDFYKTSDAMPWEPDHPWRGGPILQGIHWVIVGGESGRDARPMHPAWARQIRDQCAFVREIHAESRADGYGSMDPGPAFFFKQWGEFRPLTATERGKACGATLIGSDHYDNDAYVLRVGKKAAGRMLDGVEHDGMPEARG